MYSIWGWLRSYMFTRRSFVFHFALRFPLSPDIPVTIFHQSSSSGRRPYHTHAGGRSSLVCGRARRVYGGVVPTSCSMCGAGMAGKKQG